VKVLFSDNQAPWNMPANLGRDEILSLKPPEIESTWPMNRFIEDMGWLEREFGYVVGDLNTGGLINTGLELRGNQLFIDMVEDPELVRRLFEVIAETQLRVVRLIHARTGTSSVAVNRSIVNVDPAIYVHSNCSVQMISPALYRKALWPHELRLSREIRPFGIHHCGNNLQLYAASYAELQPVFCDVGWGSDVAKVGAALPHTFLNLRVDPVRMLQRRATEIRHDAESLVDAITRGSNVRNARFGLCSINMDYGTPDENVLALIDFARQN
jgi:hypothetical protein